MIQMQAARGGGRGTSLQPIPAVSCYKSEFSNVQKTPGTGIHRVILPPPKSTQPFSSRSSASGLHNHYQVRFSLSSCPPPQIRFVVCLMCCQSSRGLHAVHNLYRRPYSQINPIYQHRKGKRNRDESFEVAAERCYQLQKHSWVCNPLSLQQPFKSPAKASGLCLDLELDPFVWRLQQPPV